MTPEQIGQFGKPRSRRVVTVEDLPHVSLGLGSVIITKILELHKGSLDITCEQAEHPQGTHLEIRLPRA